MYVHCPVSLISQLPTASSVLALVVHCNHLHPWLIVCPQHAHLILVSQISSESLFSLHIFLLGALVLSVYLHKNVMKMNLTSDKFTDWVTNTVGSGKKAEKCMVTFVGQIAHGCKPPH